MASLKDHELHLDLDAVEEATAHAVDFLNNAGRAIQLKYTLVVNLREPSYRQRAYLFTSSDLKMVDSYHVSHGINSSDPKNRAYAIEFSNKINSKQSCLGGLITSEVYVGKHGKSLRLLGLEKGRNDNAYKRNIVIHGAPYCTEQYIRSAGRCGQSEGCLAFDPKVCDKLIDKIKDNCFVFIHY